MKTLKDLAKLVEERERELAPGSETILLGDFVNQYGFTSDILDAETDRPIDDYEYEIWGNAYNKIEEYEKEGTAYMGEDLFE